MNAAEAQRISGLIAKWAAQEPQMKEANVKLRIVQPLLAALGWDGVTGDYEMERPLKIGSSKVSVDYALLVDGNSAAFVETKGFDTALSDEDAEQVISYGRVANVRWCVLTNGRELRIYDADERGAPADSLISQLDLRQLPSKFEEIRMLEKDALLSQEVETAVSLRKALKTASRRFDDSRSEAVTAISGTLRRFLAELPEAQLSDLSDKGYAAVRSELQRLMHPQLEAARPPHPPQKKTDRSIQESDVRVLARDNLIGDSRETVIICPARVTPGVTFLLRYQAWGYVKANRPAQYLGLYVSKPHSCVLYFGAIERITPPLPSRSAVEGIDDSDLTSFEPGKRVIWLRPGTLVKLSNPIRSTSLHGHPQSPRYTTLKKFKDARNTDDLWGRGP